MSNGDQDVQEGRPPFPIDDKLMVLHNAVIQYAVRVQQAATNRQEQDPHVAYSALATIAMRAATIHRAVLSLCVDGWTPVNSVLIRTLADLYVNVVAIAFEPAHIEFMAFRYLYNFQISHLNDTSVPPAQRKRCNEELETAIGAAAKLNPARIREFIAAYKKASYWFQPEFKSPTDVLCKTKGDMPFLYRVFSGAVHGGVVGLGFLDDTPDEFDINPRNHPRRNRMAIALSSRFLLEISFVRDSVEDTGLADEYEFVKDNIFLPLRGIVSGNEVQNGTAGGP
jgi:hypothetical protein